MDKSGSDDLGDGGVGKVCVCVAISDKVMPTSGAIKGLIDRVSTDKQFYVFHTAIMINTACKCLQAAF